MAIDLEPLADLIVAFIDDLPTEASFRGQTINVRLGEAPKTRELLIAGLQFDQSIECLIKAEDVEDQAEPTAGETITIGATGYKVGTVTPLLSVSQPAGYRLTITRI